MIIVPRPPADDAKGSFEIPFEHGRPGGSTMFIAVSTLMLWYTAHAVLSLFVGTCTMGDTDRFVAGLILGMPAAVAVLALLRRASAGEGWRRRAAVTTEVLAVVVLCMWAPLAISTVFGHHLCGREFDEYPMSDWERFIPIAHVAVAYVLLRSGLNARRAWSAAQVTDTMSEERG